MNLDDLTDDQLAGIFRAFHDNRATLSAIARSIDADPPLRYPQVRGILDGSRLAARTAALRDLYPPYRHRGKGRSSKLTDGELADVFRMYHDDNLSTETIGAEVKLARQNVEGILTGLTCVEQTEHLRARYGDQLRPRGWRAGRPRRAA